MNVAWPRARSAVRAAVSRCSAVALLALAASTQASQPSMTECLEGSDFIANAARSRDAGMREDTFVSRVEEDLFAIQAYPAELRWFAHDDDDGAFLLASVHEVFAQPDRPDAHRRTFLAACVERIMGEQAHVAP